MSCDHQVVLATNPYFPVPTLDHVHLQPNISCSRKSGKKEENWKKNKHILGFCLYLSSFLFNSAQQNNSHISLIGIEKAFNLKVLL